MTHRRFFLAFLVVLAMVAGACGGGDSSDDDSAGDTTSGSEEEESAGEDDSSDGELPDACTAFSKDVLTAAFGDPGKGKAQGGGSRNTCLFENRLTVGASSPDQFERSLSLAENSGSKCSEVTGVGDKASFCTTGTVVGALWWVEDGVMYDLTFGSTDQAKFLEVANNG